MTITYGFFDSISSDRLYNAKQMGSIFDGLILDGVYGGYGDALATIEDSGMDISVGSGRTWFDHTWTYNDAAIGKTIATADALLNRIDIVYLEINENVGVRANSIDVLTGTPATDPVPPDLTNTSSIHQYALAHVYVGAAVTEIVQANITNMVGTENTPYVTILVESEDLQAQIWAIVGDIYPPLIDLIELKAHNHDGSPTVQIPAGSLATDAVIAGNIANGAVDAIATLANNIVDDTKVGNRVPAHTRRQGGHATNWSTPGTNNYTPTAVRMQSGVTVVTIDDGQLTGTISVTFPIAFSALPNVFVTWGTFVVPANVYALQLNSVGNDAVSIWAKRTGISGQVQLDVHWLAIGPE
jgi:hypothetical protein